MVPWYLTECVKMQWSLFFFPTWHIWLSITMEETNSLLWLCLSFFLSDGAPGTIQNHGKMDQLVLIVVGHVLTTYVVRILSLATMRYGCNLKMVFFKLNDIYIYIYVYIYIHIYIKHLLRNRPQVNARKLCWSDISIGSGNGLMPSGTKPFTLTNVVHQIMCRHIASLGASEFNRDTLGLEDSRLWPFREPM